MYFTVGIYHTPESGAGTGRPEQLSKSKKTTGKIKLALKLLEINAFLTPFLELHPVFGDSETPPTVGAAFHEEEFAFLVVGADEALKAHDVFALGVSVE